MASHEKHQARPVHAADRNGDNALPGVAVYVDLDNTVIDGSAPFHVGRALAAQGSLERRGCRRAWWSAWTRIDAQVRTSGSQQRPRSSSLS